MAHHTTPQPTTPGETHTMSRFSFYQTTDGRWIVYYNNAAAQRVLCYHFQTEAAARAVAERENARLWPATAPRP
jgi:hypothetical protein